MIEFVSGMLIEKNPARLVIENNGFGYNLQISVSTYEKLPEIGEKVQLKAYLHIRDDNIQLFAFNAEQERQVFLGLLSVSGIGPKLALTILSGVKLQELLNAIQKADLARLTKISGIGKKTAQRMVVELTERFSQLGFIASTKDKKKVEASFTSIEEEAIMALLSLGYKRQSIETALSKIRNNGGSKTVEDLVKRSLQVI